jgi:hypothetical protein
MRSLGDGISVMASICALWARDTMAARAWLPEQAGLILRKLLDDHLRSRHRLRRIGRPGEGNEEQGGKEGRWQQRPPRSLESVFQCPCHNMFINYPGLILKFFIIILIIFLIFAFFRSFYK